MISLTRLLWTLIFALCCASVSVGSDSAAEVGKHWFYMVKSKPSEPSRDEEFNAWYDGVDIPDVLEVPGFVRARRGKTQQVAEYPSANLESDDGNYVALYDIETADIDKSIIDLYVAARKMVALGRLTDVLKVVEANYYRRVVPPYEASASGSAGKQRYIFVRKVLCCRDATAMAQFQDWYSTTFMPEMMQAKGLVQVNLYLLYRVMEVLTVGPEEIPHFLTVYEIEAESPRQAVEGIYKVLDALNEAGLMSELYAEGDGAVYLQTSDVTSQ